VVNLITTNLATRITRYYDKGDRLLFNVK